MSSDGAAVVTRYLKVALAAARSGDFSAADELVAGDAEFHDPGPAASPSRSAHQQRWQALLGAFAEVAFEIKDLIEAGDRVVVRWGMQGVHAGPFAGVAPTGREVALAGITIYRLDDGKIAEAWSSYDGLGILDQLGVVLAAAADGDDDDDIDPDTEFGMVM